MSEQNHAKARAVIAQAIERLDAKFGDGYSASNIDAVVEETIKIALEEVAALPAKPNDGGSLPPTG